MLTLRPEEQAWLDEYRKVLGERHPGTVVRLIIYGSKARGDARDDSDLDVLLEVRDDANHLEVPLHRIGYDLAATSRAVPSIMAYTTAEWDRLKDLRSAYRESVERDGVTVP